MNRIGRIGILMLALGVGGGVARAGAAEPGRAEPAAVTLVGRVVCLGCELKREFKAPSDCATTGHVFGFRAEEGNLFTLLDTDRSRPLIRGEKSAYERVQIKGRRYPRSMILEVLEVGPAPPEAGKSSDKKTYYCSICAITSFQPGPCVCCGEPVEEVR